MARAIDLSDLSLDELYVLAGRVQSRIATLTTSTANIRQTSAREHTDPWASSGNASPDPSPSGNASPDPSRPGLVSGNRSGTQTTLSERVQDLVNTNDPWEGSGVGPTRWSLPFYGGHVIRTQESAACLHRVQHGPATLPVFGGLPQPPLLVGNLPSCLPSFSNNNMHAALCNLLLPLLLGWHHPWTTRV